MTSIKPNQTYHDEFMVRFESCASHLGAFACVSAAGDAALRFGDITKENVSVKLSFEFDGFVKSIRGVVIAGRRGYIAFIEDRDVVLSRNYMSLDLWTRFPTLKDTISKSFIHGLPMSGWLRLLDRAMFDYSGAVKLIEIQEQFATDALLKAA